MAKGGKIKPSPLATTESIRSLELKNRHLRFSFKHLDLNHRDFSVKHRNSDYFSTVLEKLKELSSFPADALRGNHSKAVRCHPIKWEDTSQKKLNAKDRGFAHLNQQLRDMDAWQFQIQKNNYGRVHGLFLDDIFFVIWFDPDHKLYP